MIVTTQVLHYVCDVGAEMEIDETDGVLSVEVYCPKCGEVFSQASGTSHREVYQAIGGH